MVAGHRVDNRCDLLLDGIHLRQGRFHSGEPRQQILSLTRQDIINDDLGALSTRAAKIGRGAALQLNEVFWKEVLSNSTFFTAARKNYFSGVNTTLQSSSLQMAEQMFMDLTDPGGNPLGLMPSILLVSTANSVPARELFQSTSIVTGSTTKDRKSTRLNSSHRT